MSQVLYHGFEFIIPAQEIFTAGNAVAVSGVSEIVIGQELTEEKPVNWQREKK